MLAEQTKEERLVEIRSARAAKVAAFDEQAKAARLDSELRLGELEAQHGLTLGVNLAAIFLPDGRLVAVKKPAAVVHNKLMLAQANGTMNDAIISEFIANVALDPVAVTCERLCLEYPNLRDAMVNAGVALGAVDQSNMLGK